ncbi:hypothetical protein ACFX15_031430 [Malus domestica]
MGGPEESHVLFPSSLGGCSVVAVEELPEGVTWEDDDSHLKRGIMEEVGELSQDVWEVMEVAVENEKVALLDCKGESSSTGDGG